MDPLVTLGSGKHKKAWKLEDHIRVLNEMRKYGNQWAKIARIVGLEMRYVKDHGSEVYRRLEKAGIEPKVYFGWEEPPKIDKKKMVSLLK